MVSEGESPPGQPRLGAGNTRAMGVRLLGDALRRRRGEAGLSQKAAAVAWNFPLATLGAIEQGVIRNYQPTTIARLDPVIGTSAWDLLQTPEIGGGLAAAATDLDQLRAELVDLRVLVADLQARLEEEEPSRLAALETVAGELTNGELDDLVAFAHFLRSRRHRVNGS
jgi:transcriptional regulator with XRE-family HTH domain